MSFVLTDEEVKDLSDVASNHLFYTRKYEEWKSSAAPGRIEQIERQRNICCRITAKTGAIKHIARWNWLTQKEIETWGLQKEALQAKLDSEKLKKAYGS